MHEMISEKLRNHLQRIGSAVLTVTLEPLCCWRGEMSLDACSNRVKEGCVICQQQEILVN
jgi:hypothetical protein